MPRGNHTGPMGMGPMTGRAAGYCTGYGMPGYLNSAPGYGGGRGFRGGGGHGWRHWYHATGLPAWMRFGGYTAPYGHPQPYVNPDPGLEKQALKAQATALQSELDLIRKRLAEVEAEKAAD